MVDYFSLLKKSFSKVFRNPALILPLVIWALLIGAWVLLLIVEFFGLIATTGITQPFFMLMNVYQRITSPSFITAVLFCILVDIILLIIINAWTKAMSIGMNQDIIDNGKTKAGNMFKHGAKYFGKCALFGIYKAVLYLVPIVIMIIINAYIFLNISKTATIISALICIMIYAIYAGILSVLLFFANPIITIEGTGAFGVLKKTMRYAKEKLSHTVLSMLTLFLLGLTAIIISIILDIPGIIFDSIKENTYMSLGLVIMMTAIVTFMLFIRIIIEIMFKLSADLFVFYCYDAERPIATAKKKIIRKTARKNKRQ